MQVAVFLSLSSQRLQTPQTKAGCGRDGCDLPQGAGPKQGQAGRGDSQRDAGSIGAKLAAHAPDRLCHYRSEEHTSELQSLMRISYAVSCLTKNNTRLLQHSMSHITNEQQSASHALMN